MAVQDIVTRIRARPVQARDLVTRIRSTAAVSLTVDAGVGRSLEPFETVALSAASSVVPDSWLWEQTDGAVVTLTGAGQSRTFVAPATLEGSTLTFQITVAKAGAAPAVDTISFTVLPHTMWRQQGSDIAPVVMNV